MDKSVGIVSVKFTDVGRLTAPFPRQAALNCVDGEIDLTTSKQARERVYIDFPLLLTVGVVCLAV